MSALSIGATGLQGWRILQGQMERYQAIVARDPVVQRSAAEFRSRIQSVQSASELVQDYKVLHVALKAFGLEEDIGSKAFIQKVLESDLQDEGSLVNRLSDKRYLRLAEMFKFSEGNSDLRNASEAVTASYFERELETKIGESDENLRLALNAQRELKQFAGRSSSDRTLWYEVLANPPLRTVFKEAFGFSDSYMRLPVDRQLEEFIQASKRFLGDSSFSYLTSENGASALISGFLSRSQIAMAPSQNRYSIAVSLLSGQLMA